MRFVVCAKCAREMARNHPSQVTGEAKKAKCQVCGKPLLCRPWNFDVRSCMVPKEC